MAILLDQVHFRWPQMANDLLHITDFHIEKGEKIFLVGPSGSGKTTFLGLLTGVLTAQRGRVSIMGQDLVKMSSAQRDCFRANHLGYIFQMFNLIPYLTVEENVLLGLRFSPHKRANLSQHHLQPKQEVKRLLDALNLPENDTFLQRKTLELSVGQQQRVAAARALLGHPDIIIADEPTSALDSTSRQKFLQSLFAECQTRGTTLIFVSHDQSMSPLFDKEVAISSFHPHRS